jgi:phosphoribosylanthranilate isomerase
VTTKIKICGVTVPGDAARVAVAGADFIGLNFWPQSKRYLDPQRAALIASAARGSGAALLVGVFVDAGVDEVVAVMQHVELDVIQLHGDEDATTIEDIADATHRPVWKAFGAASAATIENLHVWPADAIMLDTPSPQRGGTGKTFDWAIAKEARRRHPARKLVLAGGLDAANVAAAIQVVAPWAVDVASGVEASPGIKDPAKIAAFIAAVRDRDQ